MEYFMPNRVATTIEVDKHTTVGIEGVPRTARTTFEITQQIPPSSRTTSGVTESVVIQVSLTNDVLRNLINALEAHR